MDKSIALSQELFAEWVINLSNLHLLMDDGHVNPSQRILIDSFLGELKTDIRAIKRHEYMYLLLHEKIVAGNVDKPDQITDNMRIISHQVACIIDKYKLFFL